MLALYRHQRRIATDALRCHPTAARGHLMPTTKRTPDETIEYLVIQDRGEFVIELPANWQVTFGAVNPGSPPHGRDLHCLRVWEGSGTAKKLRAVFGDVRGFRDLSLPLARKVTKETGSA